MMAFLYRCTFTHSKCLIICCVEWSCYKCNLFSEIFGAWWPAWDEHHELFFLNFSWWPSEREDYGGYCRLSGVWAVSGGHAVHREDEAEGELCGSRWVSVSRHRSLLSSLLRYCTMGHARASRVVWGQAGLRHQPEVWLDTGSSIRRPGHCCWFHTWSRVTSGRHACIFPGMSVKAEGPCGFSG